MTDTDLLPDEIDNALAWWRNCPNEPWNSKYAREIDKLVLTGLESTPSSTRANERGDDSLQAQIAYSAYLQQIIEALCHGHPIPEPKGTAVHHYEMAVAYRKTPQPSPQSEMVAVPRKTLDKIMYFLKYLEGWQGKDGDAVVVEVAEDAIALLQPYTKGEK